MPNETLISAQILPLGGTDNDPLSYISRIFCGYFLRDRFNKLNKYSPYRVSNKEDQLVFPKNTNFSSLMDNRAQKLLDTNSSIGILYSGGINSIGVCSALLRNIPSSQEDRLTIVYNSESFKENPAFYDFLKKTKVNFYFLEEDYLREDLENLEFDLLTSGFCGDQIFGVDTLLIHPGIVESSFKDGLTTAFKAKLGLNLSQKVFENFAEIFQNYANDFNVHLDSFAKFTWLFNWAIKYGHTRDIPNAWTIETPLKNKGNAFFDSEVFQSWSLFNHEELSSRNWIKFPELYKKELKDYISEYFIESKYLPLKTKQDSLYFPQQEPGKIILSTDQGFKKSSLAINKDCGQCNLKFFAKIRKYFKKDF